MRQAVRLAFWFGGIKIPPFEVPGLFHVEQSGVKGSTRLIFNYHNKMIIFNLVIGNIQFFRERKKV